MRIFIGGIPYIFPARWFFCNPGAKVFPGGHGCEASPWLSNYERNDAWGEVTPYPTDPGASYSRGLDRGQNPGYAGQCFVGDPSWFVDGELPADILSRPTFSLPPCCFVPPVESQGGLCVTGTAVASGPFGASSVGGLAIGGTALPSGPKGYHSAGGLALTGSAIAPTPPRWVSDTPLVLGGSGRPVGPPGYASYGGIVLGGKSLPWSFNAISLGGLAIGGRGSPVGTPSWISRGPLVLGGSARTPTTPIARTVGGLAIGGQARGFRGEVWLSRGGLAVGGGALSGSGQYGAATCTHGLLIDFNTLYGRSLPLGAKDWYAIPLVKGEPVTLFASSHGTAYPPYHYLIPLTCSGSGLAFYDGKTSYTPAATGYYYIGVFFNGGSGQTTYQIAVLD